MIELYHHKSDAPFTQEYVEKQAEQLGFTYSVAIDKDWKTLKHWWLKDDSRRWTSVSFLLERKGKVFHIHEGGAFFPGEPSYSLLEQKIEEALKHRNQNILETN